MTTKTGPKTAKSERHPVLGGKAHLVRNESSGIYYLWMWVASEKRRYRKTLKTTSFDVAMEKGTELALEMMARERSGTRVLSGTLRDALREFATKQRARLARGQIRSDGKLNQVIADLTNQLEKFWGLDTLLSEMTQERWDIYVQERDDVKLTTLKGHTESFRRLMRDHGLKLGAPLVPDFSYLTVPPEQRSKRFEVITEKQWDELASALIFFMGPENEDGTYKRSFRFSAHQPVLGTGAKLGKINTRLEKHRRKVLYRFVMCLAASGLRPHEMAGYTEKSLRWRDVDDAGFSVETKQLSQRERPVVMLNVRKNTKTGQRTVPSACAEHIEKLREFAPDLDKNACVFQDHNGKPMPLATMRFYFNEVCSRCETIDRSIDLYELRHLWATRRLQEGVPVATVAQAMGNSVDEVMKTYSHVMMGEEGMTRLLYENSLKTAG